jgi:hypothetical protein
MPCLIVVMIANALQIIPSVDLMFVLKKTANAPAIKNMMVEPAIAVRQNIMDILIVNPVNAIQTTQRTNLMFAIMSPANVYAKKNSKMQSVISVWIIIYLQRTSNTVKLVTNILIYAMDRKEIVLAMMDSSNQKTANIAMLLMLILISNLMVNV